MFRREHYHCHLWAESKVKDKSTHQRNYCKVQRVEWRVLCEHNQHANSIRWLIRCLYLKYVPSEYSDYCWTLATFGCFSAHPSSSWLLKHISCKHYKYVMTVLQTAKIYVYVLLISIAKMIVFTLPWGQIDCRKLKSWHSAWLKLSKLRSCV